METPDIIMSNPSIADVPPCVGGYLRAFHQANYSRDCCTQRKNCGSAPKEYILRYQRFERQSCCSPTRLRSYSVLRNLYRLIVLGSAAYRKWVAAWPKEYILGFYQSRRQTCYSSMRVRSYSGQIDLYRLII